MLDIIPIVVPWSFELQAIPPEEKAGTRHKRPPVGAHFWQLLLAQGRLVRPVVLNKQLDRASRVCGQKNISWIKVN